MSMTPHDKICAAIAILQDHILASGTEYNAEMMFPLRRFETASLELAETLLSDLVPYLENAKERAA